MEQHSFTKHPDKLTCPACKREFKNINWYSKHISRCKSTVSYVKCNICGVKLKNNDRLNAHIAKEHTKMVAVVRTECLNDEQIEQLVSQYEDSSSNDEKEKTGELKEDPGASVETENFFDKKLVIKLDTSSVTENQDDANEIRRNVKIDEKDNKKIIIENKNEKVDENNNNIDGKTVSKEIQNEEKKPKKVKRKVKAKSIDRLKSVKFISPELDDSSDADSLNKVKRKQRREEKHKKPKRRMLAMDMEAEKSPTIILPEVSKNLKTDSNIRIHRKKKLPVEEKSGKIKKRKLAMDVEMEPRRNVFSLLSSLTTSDETDSESIVQYKCDICYRNCKSNAGVVNHKRYHHTQEYKKLQRQKVSTDNVTENFDQTGDNMDKDPILQIRIQQVPVPLNSTVALQKNFKKKRGPRRPTRLLQNKHVIKNSNFYCYKCRKQYDSYMGLKIHKGHKHCPHSHIPKKSDKFQEVKQKKSKVKNIVIVPSEPPETNEKESTEKESTALKEITPITTPQQDILDFTKEVKAIRTPLLKHVCLICDKGFKFAKSLTNHMEINHSQFKCEYCESTFKERKIYLLHKRVHARKNAGKAYKCKICKRTFSMQTAYTMHKRYHKLNDKVKIEKENKVRTVDPNDPYDFVFNTKNQFPFFCEVCQLGFIWMTDLALHSTLGGCGVCPPVASPRKTYGCEQCEQVFTKKHSLLHHSSQFHFKPKQLFLSC